MPDTLQFDERSRRRPKRNAGVPALLPLSRTSRLGNPLFYPMNKSAPETKLVFADFDNAEETMAGYAKTSTQGGRISCRLPDPPTDDWEWGVIPLRTSRCREEIAQMRF